MVIKCHVCLEDYSDSLDMCPYCGCEESEEVDLTGAIIRYTHGHVPIDRMMGDEANYSHEYIYSVKELKKEIERKQQKKQSLLSSLHNEIRGATQNRDGLFCHIGQVVYENRDNELFTVDHCRALFTQVHNLDLTISENEQNVCIIESQYDEEIKTLVEMLEKLEQADSDSTFTGQMSCPKCGDAYTPKETYCGNCGHSLSEANLCDLPTDENKTPSFCGECGARFYMDDVYCGECGSKLV